MARLRNKGAGVYLLLMAGIFLVGIILGSIYARDISKDESSELYNYLCEFFQANDRDGLKVFLASLEENIKIFLVIFAAGFFKFGIPVIMGAGCVEGFISGFTAASLIKLMGMKGLLLNLSCLLSVIIFLLVLFFYGAYAMNFGLSTNKRERNSKKNYIIFSLLALTIFCIASLFDGYITTIFMKLVVTKM